MEHDVGCHATCLPAIGLLTRCGLLFCFVVGCNSCSCCSFCVLVINLEDAPTPPIPWSGTEKVALDFETYSMAYAISGLSGFCFESHNPASTTVGVDRLTEITQSTLLYLLSVSFRAGFRLCIDVSWWFSFVGVDIAISPDLRVKVKPFPVICRVRLIVPLFHRPASMPATKPVDDYPHGKQGTAIGRQCTTTVYGSMEPKSKITTDKSDTTPETASVYRHGRYHRRMGRQAARKGRQAKSMHITVTVLPAKPNHFQFQFQPCQKTRPRKTIS